MEFASKEKRNFIFSLVLGSIPDLMVSFAVSIFFSLGIVGFLFAYIGLQLLYFSLWLIRTIIDWIIYSLKKEEAITLFFNKLIQNKFPEPDEYENSAQTYLEDIVNDSNVPIEARLCAMSDLTYFMFLNQNYKILQSMRLSMLFEEAISRYKNFLAKNNK